jgi:hypothetical protein
MTPDSTVPSDTDRLAEAAPLTDEDLEAIASRGKPSRIEAGMLVTEVYRLRAEAEEFRQAMNRNGFLWAETYNKLKAAREENASLQGRLDTAEGQLAKWREIHQPERRYTPDDGETSYATYLEAADDYSAGSGTPVSVTFFEVCSHCASIEMVEGCGHDYRESLWPCKDAEAAGLGEGDGQ